MLFSRQQKVNTSVAAILLVLAYLLLVLSFTLIPASRIIPLLLMLSLSSLSIALLRLSIRIAPINAIFEEWSDATALMALMSTEQKEDLAKQSEKTLQKLKINLLPQSHYLFSGVDAKKNREMFIDATRFRGESEILDIQNNRDKMRYQAIVNERKSMSGDAYTPVFVYSDLFHPNQESDKQLQIFWLVASNENYPIQNRFISFDELSNFSDLPAESKDSLLLFNGRQVYEIDY